MAMLKNAIMRPDCAFVISRDYSSPASGISRGLRIRSLADSTDREIRRINNVENLYRIGELD